MDILNFISWLKGGRVVNTVDAAKTLLPVGLKDNRRDDDYLAGAITVEDFTTQVGDTVRPYKVYTAILSQNGVSAPVANVLDNTLGIVPTYAYTNVGQYTISGITPSPFDVSKTFIILQGGSFNVIGNIIGGGPNAGKIQILNYDTSGIQTNLSGNEAYLEIRVYN